MRAQADRIENRPAEAGWRDAIEAADEARRRADATPALGFEAILRAPDDPELNFRYAREMIAQDDLRGAVAALERILVRHPEYDQVRLVLAVLLFRLDSLQEAEIAFREVLARNADPKTRSEIERYLAEIALRQKNGRLTLSLSTGFDYNSNRISAPSSRTLLFFDTPLATRGAEDDVALLGIVALQWRQDLGLQERHEMLANASIYFADQTRIDRQDLLAFSAELGGIYRSAALDVTPSVIFTAIGLDGESYLQAPGGRVLVERHFDAFDISGTVTAQQQNFLPGKAAPTEDRRDGMRVDLETALHYRLAPAHRLGLAYAHTVKAARSDFEAFQADQVSVSHTWLLGSGQFLVSSLGFTDYRYDEADSFVSSRTRHDREFRIRAVYGVPLGTIGGALGIDLPTSVADVTMSVLVEGRRTESNIPNYEHDNLRVQMLWTKRFDW